MENAVSGNVSDCAISFTIAAMGAVLSSILPRAMSRMPVQGAKVSWFISRAREPEPSVEYARAKSMGDTGEPTASVMVRRR